MSSKKRDKYTGIVLMIIGILIIWFAIFGCSAKPQRNTWYYTNGIVGRDTFTIDSTADGYHIGEWRKSNDTTNPIVAFRNSHMALKGKITRIGRLGIGGESYDWIGDECGGYYMRTSHDWGLKIIFDTLGRRIYMIRDSIDPKDTFKFNY